MSKDLGFKQYFHVKLKEDSLFIRSGYTADLLGDNERYKSLDIDSLFPFRLYLKE
ncbi:MAG: hypothetical protein ACI9N1_000739 [Flavobacteriales bacterium]|jgi:hypothetical protein